MLELVSHPLLLNRHQELEVSQSWSSALNRARAAIRVRRDLADDTPWPAGGLSLNDHSLFREPGAAE